MAARNGRATVRSKAMRFLASITLALAAHAQPARPHFDVASVKMPADQDVFQARPTRTPGRFRWTTQLCYLMGYAWHTEWWRISGDLPGFGDIYQVEATHDPKATEDDIRLMLQSLLIDRFKMKFHPAPKLVDGYALSVANDGPKMQEAKDDEIAPLPDYMRGPNTDAAGMEGRVIVLLTDKGVGILAGRRVTMLELTEALQRQLDTAVLDRTGLPARYYFAVRYATENDPDIPYPTLAGALKDLGLRLEKHKGPAEMIVIDHLERIPVEN
jgi:uncharacterized protein (TIGR03435 family)